MHHLDNHGPRSREARGLSHVQSSNGDLTLQLLRRKGEAALDDGKAANIRAWQVEVAALEGGGMAGTPEHKEAKEILADLIEAQREWMATPPTGNGHAPVSGPLVHADEAGLPMESVADLLDGPDEDFDPVIPHFAYRGLKTLVVGQSKAGKSFTVLAKSVEAARRGLRVLYLSEESRSTLRDKLRLFGAEPDLPLRVSRKYHEQMHSLPWHKVAEKIVAAVEREGFALVVVDTARPWLGLKGEESNQDTTIGSAVDLLGPVCDRGAAVVVLHQAPWDKKRARGSTEWHASVDAIFAIEGAGKDPRTLTYLGGRVDEIPDHQTFRLSPDGRLEELGDVRPDTAKSLDEALRCVERSDEPPSAEEIADELELHEKTVRRQLGKLEKGRRVVRIPGRRAGAGSEPDRWRVAGRFERLIP